MPQTGDEAADVRHVRHHVVGVNDVGRAAFGSERCGQRFAEELRIVSMPRPRPPPRYWWPARCRAPHARRDVVLQQVPVVARDLDDARGRAESALPNQASHQRAGVCHHLVGIGREVRVGAEQALGRHQIGQLHQRTILAADHFQRETFLRRIRVENDGVGKRRDAEVQNREEGGAPAGSTAVKAHLVSPSRRRYQSMVSPRPLSSE